MVAEALEMVAEALEATVSLLLSKAKGFEH
jgi:hypothetical protein